MMSNFANYFNAQSPMEFQSIKNDVTGNATNSTQQPYSLSTESLEFISNSSTLVNQEVLSAMQIDDPTPTPNEKSAIQFPCREDDCRKTYTTISGLNNHMKK